MRHRSKLVKLVISAVLFVLAVQGVRTMADTLLTSPTPTSSPSPTSTASDTSTVSASPSPDVTGSASASPSSSASAPSSSAPTVSASASPSITPPAASSGQGLTIHLPPTLPLDPRATVATLPAIAISGASDLLVCVDSLSNSGSETLSLDVGTKRSIDQINTATTIVSGDLTSHLLISGSIDWVNATLNSASGLRILSSPYALTGKSILMRFVAVTKPASDSSLCAQGAVANQRLLTFSTLGLEIDMVEGRIHVKG